MRITTRTVKALTALAAVFVVVLMLAGAASVVLTAATVVLNWHSTLSDEDDAADILILGVGGAYWADGVQAVETSGTLTWACELSSGGLALVEEDTATLWRWHPDAQKRAATLHRLRRPVQCVQHGASLYVACFGLEEEAGHSGLAVLDVDPWTVRLEKALHTTTHVHHVYPLPAAADGSSTALLLMDLGDPWVVPPVLGGVHLLRDAPGVEPTRVGPPLHSRAAVLPRTLVRAHAHPVGRPTEGAAHRLDELLYIITQEPYGEATRVVALNADWSGSMLNASVAADVLLPRATLPSDGGADIFTLRGRLFATDRYAGNGTLYELGWSSGRLRVLTSVELGVHPRYTDPLGTRDTIYSVSRDDALLTIIDASSPMLVVRARQHTHVAQPSFLARYAPSRL
jgi:hypothetical protein